MAQQPPDGIGRPWAGGVAMNPGPKIRCADLPDVRPVVSTLCAAQRNHPLSRWLIPDEIQRHRRHPAFFRVFVEHTLRWGEVHTTSDCAGVALWLRVDAAGEVQLEAAEELFGAALGPYLPRFQLLDERMKAAHPTEVRHYYLSLLAVTPGRQRDGIHDALLAHALSRLDQRRLPSYVVAGDPSSVNLHERHGYTKRPDTILLPDGPRLQPMWRDPQPVPPPGNPDSAEDADSAGDVQHREPGNVHDQRWPHDLPASNDHPARPVTPLRRDRNTRPPPPAA